MSTVDQKQNNEAEQPQPTNVIPQIPNPFGITTERYRLHETLQGFIHGASYVNQQNERISIIIKQTYKALVRRKVSKSLMKIQEDFQEEKRILVYLSSQPDVDPGICRIVNNFIWEDAESYYYAIQHCASGLFEYIQYEFDKQKNGTMSQIISNPSLNTQPYMPWVSKIQNIFRQICRSVAYMHSKGIAHLDLSLENTLLFTPHGEAIKLIDFGVSHDIRQHRNSWISRKSRVGKINYMAPEVWANVPYDARKADVWTLGVMLFMMLTGSPPYKKPIIKSNSRDSRGDVALTYLVRGQLDKILTTWNRHWMVSDDARDLLMKIFKLENDRLSMHEVLQHPFVGISLSCTGNLNVNRCPHIARICQVLKHYNNSELNQYDCATVRVLNDFNHILQDHIQPNPAQFDEIYQLLLQQTSNGKLIDINTSNILKRLYRVHDVENNDNYNLHDNGNDDNDAEKRLYESTHIAVLDKIFCYFAYSKQMGYSIDERAVEDISGLSRSLRAKQVQLKKQPIFQWIHKRMKQEKYKFTCFGLREAGSQLGGDYDAKMQDVADQILDEEEEDYVVPDIHKLELDASKSRGDEDDDDTKMQDEDKPRNSVVLPSEIIRTVSSEQDYYDITKPIFYGFKSMIMRHLNDQLMSHAQFINFIESVIENSMELKSKITPSELQHILYTLSSRTNMNENHFIKTMSAEKFRDLFTETNGFHRHSDKRPPTLQREVLYKLYQEIVATINANCLQKLEELDEEQLAQMVYRSLCEDYGCNMNFIGDDGMYNYDVNDSRLREIFINGKINGYKFSLMSDIEICQLVSQCIHCYDHVNESHIIGKRFRYLHRRDKKYVEDVFNGLQVGHWFVNRRYADIKRELLDNNIIRLSSKQWKQIMFYVEKVLIHTIQIKKYRASIHSNNLSYTVNNKEVIKVPHLISLVLYCNYPQFARALLESYRFEIDSSNYKNYASWINAMRRHHELANLAMYLRETVECYGEFANITHHNKYYQLIDQSTLILNSKYLRFNAPISMSSQYNVCYNMLEFTQDSCVNGSILELSVPSTTSRLKCFDCQFISDFPNQNECLFIGGLGALKVNNIININAITNRFDLVEYKDELNAIEVLYRMLKGEQMTNKEQTHKPEPPSPDVNVCHAFTKLIHNALRPAKQQRYIDKVFQRICHGIQFRHIRIDMTLLLHSNDMFYQSLKNVLFDDVARTVQYNVICKLFGRNLERVDIVVKNDRAVSSEMSVFDADSMSLLQNSKLCTFKQINFIGTRHFDINLGNFMNRYDAQFRKNKCSIKSHSINNLASFTIEREYY